MGGPGSGRKKGFGIHKDIGKAPPAVSRKLKSTQRSGVKVRNGLYEYKGHSIEKVSTKQGFGFNGWLVSKSSSPRDANVYGTRSEAMKALRRK